MNETAVSAPKRIPVNGRRPPSAAFGRFVVQTPSTKPALPIVDTTNALSLREMVELGEMTPQPCDVFAGEQLLYFFYGKPAYRLFTDYDSALTAEAPIALILSASIAAETKRLFPFDSGGFERYRRFMPKQFELQYFDLAPAGCEPGQIVSTFFDSNAKYFAGAPKLDFDAPPDQFELASFLELLRYKGKDAFDDRAWTIELQIPNTISLNSSTVLAVILPSILADTELGRRVSSEWQAEILPYDFTGRGRPIEYHSAVRDLTKSFLQRGQFV